MTAKEIKDYLRTEEKILWDEHLKVERELLEKGIKGVEQWESQKYAISIAEWSAIWRVLKDLGITEE